MSGHRAPAATMAVASVSVRNGGGGRLEADMDQYARALEERVVGLVEGYQQLQTLATFGPGLVHQAAERITEEAIGEEGCSASRIRKLQEAARTRDELLSTLSGLQEQRLAVARSLTFDCLTTTPPTHTTLSQRLPFRQRHLMQPPSTAPVARPVDQLVRTDRPLPIPSFPSSLGPNRALQRLGTEAMQQGRPPAGGGDRPEAPPAGGPSKRTQMNHGYALPPEVQAALLYLPRPDASHLRRSLASPSGIARRRAKSPARVPPPPPPGLGGAYAKQWSAMMRLQRDLRAKITRLERKEQEDLTTVTSLVHDQAKRQEDVATALQELRAELARQREDAQAWLLRQQHTPTPRQPTPAPSPPSPFVILEEDEGAALYKILEPSRPPPAPTPLPSPAVRDVPCIDVEAGGEVELLLSSHGVRTELVPPPPRGLRREEEEEEEASVASSTGDTSLASLGRRVVTVTGEGGADGLDGVDRRWWAHTFDEGTGVASGRIVDMAPDKVDTEGLWRRLQDLLTVQEEEEEQAPKEEPPPPPPEAVVEPPEPTPIVVEAPPPPPPPVPPQLPVFDEEEMARRLQAERAKWELERERALLAERDQHLREAREREEKERAERGQMATLLSDLHLRINGIEAHRTAPAEPPPPPPPVIVNVAPPPPREEVEGPSKVDRAIQTTTTRVQAPPPPVPPPLTVPVPTDESDHFSAVSLLSPIAKDDDEEEASFAASWGHRSETETYLAPPSPLGSSTSEGQIYVDDGGDDVSEGQLTRHYRRHRPRPLNVTTRGRAAGHDHATTQTMAAAGRGGQGVGGSVREGGWRLGDDLEDASPLHSDVDVSMQTDDVGGGGLDDSQDSIGQEGRNRRPRSGEARGMSVSPVARPLRLLRWRPNA